MRYYVQDIADNYLKNLSDEQASIMVAPCFLYGADRQDFTGGFNALNKLLRSLYTDIAASPAAFGMPLKEEVESDAKNTDYTNSGAGFVRVPNLLFVMGNAGELQPDMTLIIDGGKLLAAAKELKITGIPALLGKLIDYGFTIEGLKKSVKETDALHVSYPDNRYLITALKAMSDAVLMLNKGDMKKNKNYFYMLHSGLLENEKVKNPKLTLEHLSRTLDGDKQGIASALDAAVADKSKKTVKMGGFMRNDWGCVYTGNTGKKVLMSLNTVQDKLDAKLNLQNISKYIDTVDGYPDNIRKTIKTSGWECGHCHDSCAGPFSFTMDGKEYYKCRCGAFLFQNITSDEVPYCVDMLEKELACQGE